ncbi:MAG: hypothetical protein AB1403_09335 [Candidatus Riflebacteria bacterium]
MRRKIALIAVLVFTAVCLSQIVAADAFAEISQSVAESHIEANVAEQPAFEKILTRDLEAYFSEIFEAPVKVEYEMLRNEPTQSGVALPKFYLWVTLRTDEKAFSSGAVRVAAVERQFFEITHFLSLEEIRAHPETIRRVFPGPICDKILGRARLAD